MYIAFNELSGELMSNGDDKIKQADAIINSFILLLKQIKEQGLIDGILCEKDYSIICCKITKEYGISEWINDKKTDKEYKRFFMSYISKNMFTYEKKELLGKFFVKSEENEKLGLGCTYAQEHDCYVLSIGSDTAWKNNIIKGRYSKNDEKENIVYINNLFDKNSLAQFKLKHSKDVYSNISSGYDLRDQKEILFPNLVFCDSVKEQLANDPERNHIIQIMEKLANLQQYFESCGDYYNPKDLGMDARTESASVKNNPELKKYRLFRLPDGREEYFYDHIGFTGKFKAGRIHFLPSPKENVCYIGYIGRHLPTKNY